MTTDDNIRARRAVVAEHVNALKAAVAGLPPPSSAAPTPGEVLHIYRRVNVEFRAIASDARGRLDRAESVLADAREFARRRRRRAGKIAGRATAPVDDRA